MSDQYIVPSPYFDCLGKPVGSRHNYIYTHDLVELREPYKVTNPRFRPLEVRAGGTVGFDSSDLAP